MVDISSQNNKINVTVSSSGNTANTNVTPDSAMYYSNKSKEWAISNRIVDNTDYSSKYYANESKKQADISTAKATEVVESGNTALTNIDMAKDNAIIDITNQESLSVDNVNTAGATQIALATEQANIATEQATIATNKTTEVVASGNEALSNIDTAKTGAITDITNLKNTSISDITTTKDNAITTITTQETTSKNNVIATGNEQVDRVIATGNNYDNLTHKNITNCLLEVPQMIKADIVDGTLTVYAGSRCIVPYGTDAPTYLIGDYLLGEANNNLYKIVDIQYDANIDYPVLDQPLLFYTVEVQRDLSIDVSSLSTSTVYLINLIVNSTIEPSLDIDYCDVRLVGTTNSANNKYLVYDTTTNYVLSDTGHFSVGTLPVLVYNNREFLNVFDCVGFIGNTVYIHKNISMLMGIGKNSDGSQKNIEYTTDKLYLYTIRPTTTNYFYYVGFENGVSINPDSKKLIFDNPNITFVGSSSLGTFINAWKMWNFRTGKWEFYSSAMNDGVPFQVYNAIFGRLWFEDGKIIRLYLNPTGMLKTDEEKGVTTSEQDSLSTMNVLVSGANLNNFRKAGTYYFSNSHTPINIPTGVNGVLQVITNEERTLVKQIWFRHGTINSNDTQTWIRTYTYTNTETNTFGWSDWQQIPTYTNKNATNGYARIGSTLIQWGQATTKSDTYALVTFPHAFSSSSSYQITTIRIASNDPENAVGVSNKTATNVRLWTNNGTVNWIAIGY